jgi:hypothetical protein
VELTNIRILWPTLKAMKPYLPRRIFSQIDSFNSKPRITRKQLSEVTRLGKTIGLEKNEIIAAIDAPLLNQGITTKERLLLFISLIVVSVIVVVSILLVWLVVDPESYPIPTPTYIPGSLYGSIQPQDFSNQYLTMLER